MGLITKLLSFSRTTPNGANTPEVKVDSGGGVTHQSELFQTANIDSVPLPGDYVATVRVQRKGGEVAVGVIDPNQDATAEGGEFRAYSRDDTQELAQIHIKNDASILLENDSVEVTLLADGSAAIINSGGGIQLLPDGTVDINGVIFDPSGNVVGPIAITAQTVVGVVALSVAGIPVLGHDHPAGTPPGDTGPMQ